MEYELLIAAVQVSVVVLAIWFFANRLDKRFDRVDKGLESLRGRVIAIERDVIRTDTILSLVANNAGINNIPHAKLIGGKENPE